MSCHGKLFLVSRAIRPARSDIAMRSVHGDFEGFRDFREGQLTPNLQDHYIPINFDNFAHGIRSRQSLVRAPRGRIEPELRRLPGSGRLIHGA